MLLYIRFARHHNQRPTSCIELSDMSYRALSFINYLPGDIFSLPYAPHPKPGLAPLSDKLGHFGDHV